MRPAVSALIAALQGGFPTFVLDEHQATTWDHALARFDDQELAFAAVQVVNHHRYGAPSVGVVVAAIEGELRTEEVPETDCWGRTILTSPGGPPKTKRVPVRRSLSGQYHPGRDGLREHLGLPALETQRLVGLPTGEMDPEARRLIEGAARRTKDRS